MRSTVGAKVGLDGHEDESLGIWTDRDRVGPSEWREATADLRIPEAPEPDPVARPDSLWWRVSVVTLTASFLGFSLGAGVARFREPDLISTRPRLVLEDDRERPSQPTTTNKGDKVSHKISRRPDRKPDRKRQGTKEQLVVAAAADQYVVTTEVKGTRFVRAPSSTSKTKRPLPIPPLPELVTVYPGDPRYPTPPNQGTGDPSDTEETSPEPDPSPTSEADDDNTDSKQEPEVADGTTESESDRPGNSEDAPGHNKLEGNGT